MFPIRRSAWWPVLMVAFAAIGAGVATLSTIDHFTFVTAGGAHGLCAAISESGCREAHSSPAAEMFGVPISLFGLAFYVAVAVIGLLAWRASRKDDPGLLGWAPAAVTAAASAGLGYSVWLASLLIEAGEWCPFCAALYGVNAALLATSLGWTWPGIRQPSLTRIAACLALLGLLATAAGSVSWAVYATGVNAAAREAASVPAEGKQTTYSHHHMPELPKRLPSKGLRDAPATIVEFSDFECPYCAAMHEIISTLFAQVGPHRLRVRFVNYPLDNSCNCYVSACVHENACLAARGAICAQEAGAFWRFADLSFENRKRHSRGDLLGYARQAGIDITSFEVCLDSERTRATLAEDIEIAHSVRVKATPTIIVNGVKFEGMMSLDRLQQSLDRSEICACDLKTEFCEEHAGMETPSCGDMEIIGGSPSCQ